MSNALIGGVVGVVSVMLGVFFWFVLATVAYLTLVATVFVWEEFVD